MKQVFCILGYGVPKNILQDATYGHYLSTAAKYIHKCEAKGNVQPVVILSGGRTDCFVPYKRTEAGEMKRYFNKNKRTNFSSWKCMEEKSSLSTLENFIHCAAIIKKHRLPKQSLVVFCEKSRLRRVRILAHRVLKGCSEIRVVPVSFGKTTRSEKKFIQKKESRELRHALDALKSKRRLMQHHEFFKKKFVFLRKAGPKNTDRAMREWWEYMRQFTFI